MAIFTRGPYPRLRLVALLGALLLAAGCGGRGTFSRDPVASAADKTLDKSSAHFALTMQVRTAQSGRAVALSGTGSFDSADQSFDMTMSLPQLGTVETRMLFPVMYLQLNGIPGI